MKSPFALMGKVAVLLVAAVLSGCWEMETSVPPTPTIVATSPTPVPKATLPLFTPTLEPLPTLPASSTLDAVTLVRSDVQHTGMFSNGGTPKLDNVIWAYPPMGSLKVGLPIIYAGNLYMQIGTREASDIHVIDAQTGQFKWQLSDAGPFTIADGVMYYSRDCVLHAIDLLSHQERWKFISPCYGSISGMGRPVVRDGIVYVEVSHMRSGGYILYSFDASSGVERWSLTREDVMQHLLVGRDHLFFSTPVRMNNDSHHILWIDGLFAMEHKPGARPWTFEPPGEKASERVIDDLVVTDGAVYFTLEGYFPSDSHFLYSLDSKSGTVRWKFRPKDSLYFSGEIAVSDNLVYFASTNGVVYALDVQNGVEQWRFQAGRKFLAPAISGDVLYLSGTHELSRSGQLYALDRNTGKLLEKLLIARELTSSPLIWNDTLYVLTETQVMAVR